MVLGVILGSNSAYSQHCVVWMAVGRGDGV